MSRSMGGISFLSRTQNHVHPHSPPMISKVHALQFLCDFDPQESVVLGFWSVVPPPITGIVLIDIITVHQYVVPGTSPVVSLPWWRGSTGLVPGLLQDRPKPSQNLPSNLGSSPELGPEIRPIVMLPELPPYSRYYWGCGCAQRSCQSGRLLWVGSTVPWADSIDCAGFCTQLPDLGALFKRSLLPQVDLSSTFLSPPLMSKAYREHMNLSNRGSCWMWLNRYAMIRFVVV